MAIITARFRSWWVAVAVAVALLAASAIGLLRQQAVAPVSFASGNGHIEATEYDIVTKRTGRIDQVLVDAGDRVSSEQILVRMDAKDIEAELRHAEALLRQARNDKQRALAQISQREADIKQSNAAITQRESELVSAKQDFERVDTLLKRELIAKRLFDESQTRLRIAEATLAQERARKLMVEALLHQAKAQNDQRDAVIDAALANIQKIKNAIKDSMIKSPVDGRVLYRLAEPGEVLAAGGKVLTILQLTGVYMTVYLPTTLAVRLHIGAEARIVLDGARPYVIPATVSLVAPSSAFKSKEVEAQGEREKSLLRVTLKIAPEVLKKYIERVKTGLPGVAYVRLDDGAPWPENLQVKLPS